MSAFCWLFCVMLSINVHATISTLNTYPPAEEEQLSVIESTNLTKVTDDSYKAGLQRFDVDEEGNYVLGFSSGSNNWAYVYDKDGSFLYGFRYTTTGTHGIELCEDGLIIFHLRGSIAMTYDNMGVCIDVQKVIANTKESNMQIHNFLHKVSEEVAKKTYQMERDVNIGSSYSRFVVIDEYGEETILYSDTTNHSIEIIGIVLGLAFLGFIITGSVIKNKN